MFGAVGAHTQGAVGVAAGAKLGAAHGGGGEGITGADLSRLTFKNVRRPIWPLDPAEAIALAGGG